jgi:hypothetical protein
LEVWLEHLLCKLEAKFKPQSHPKKGGVRHKSRQSIIKWSKRMRKKRDDKVSHFRSPW